MRRLGASARVERLVDEAIEAFDLDLRGLTVLTETASGPFVVTPLLAARAGAAVVAVTRDSRFGTAAEVTAYTSQWARRLGVADAVDVHAGSALERAAEADVVTNLGFVRPIDTAFLARLRPGAVVSLMCEPWEARLQDVDVAACRAAGVPVLGTNESDPRLQTFRFVGMLALKLLLELEVEVLLSRVVLVSSEPFAGPIAQVLGEAGADLTLVDVTAGAELAATSCPRRMCPRRRRGRRRAPRPASARRRRHWCARRAAGVGGRRRRAHRRRRPRPGRTAVQASGRRRRTCRDDGHH